MLAFPISGLNVENYQKMISDHLIAYPIYNLIHEDNYSMSFPELSHGSRELKIKPD